jgi:hypothetical protein
LDSVTRTCQRLIRSYCSRQPEATPHFPFGPRGSGVLFGRCVEVMIDGLAFRIRTLSVLHPAPLLLLSRQNVEVFRVTVRASTCRREFPLRWLFHHAVLPSDSLTSPSPHAGPRCRGGISRKLCLATFVSDEVRSWPSHRADWRTVGHSVTSPIHARGEGDRPGNGVSGTTGTAKVVPRHRAGRRFAECQTCTRIAHILVKRERSLVNDSPNREREAPVARDDPDRTALGEAGPISGAASHDIRACRLALGKRWGVENCQAPLLRRGLESPHVGSWWTV